MPMYFFHVKNGGGARTEDGEGSDHPDYPAAVEEAVDSLRCLTVEAIRCGRDATHYSLEIADLSGMILGTLSAQYVLEARPTPA